jgi:subtilase family serine protease
MHHRRISRQVVLGVATVTVAATTIGLTSLASAASAHPARLAVEGTGLGALAPSHKVRVVDDNAQVRISVFVSHDRTGLARTAQAVANPAGSQYRHFLTPAQVSARFGATGAERAAVAGWLRGSGLRITHSDPFTVTALGRASAASAALGSQVVSIAGDSAVSEATMRPVTVPASVAPYINTVNLSPLRIPGGLHQQLPNMGGSGTSRAIVPKCSAFYDQKKAKGTPEAYGKVQDWAVCGYTPDQLRGGYEVPDGATGKGITIGILSEDNDTTALSDANTFFKNLGEKGFKNGQFTVDMGGNPPYQNGALDEDAMDIASTHSIATGAKVIYSIADGHVTGRPLLDALDQLVTAKSVDVVTSSWFEGYMTGVPQSLIDSWETVLDRASAEGISVNFATGDYADTEGLQYPGSDPEITTVGGTSMAIDQDGRALWEAPWQTDYTGLNSGQTGWAQTPPGSFIFGGAGGISLHFKEPKWQKGVVAPKIDPTKMRAVPDVSALGDPAIGGFTYGLTVNGHYTTETNGGTSLSSPLFTAMEADALQVSGSGDLGFANPTLYKLSGSAAFEDIVQDPLGDGKPLANVTGPSLFGAIDLMTTAQCDSTVALVCGPGYDTVTGVGAPRSAFYTAFTG